MGTQWPKGSGVSAIRSVRSAYARSGRGSPAVRSLCEERTVGPPLRIHYGSDRNALVFISRTDTSRNPERAQCRPDGS